MLYYPRFLHWKKIRQDPRNDETKRKEWSVFLSDSRDPHVVQANLFTIEYAKYITRFVMTRALLDQQSREHWFQLRSRCTFGE